MDPAKPNSPINQLTNQPADTDATPAFPMPSDDIAASAAPPPPAPADLPDQPTIMATSSDDGSRMSGGKKFGTGKMIAAIFGILLLVGGLMGGLLLTQNPKETIPSKAGCDTEPGGVTGCVVIPEGCSVTAFKHTRSASPGTTNGQCVGTNVSNPEQITLGGPGTYCPSNDGACGRCVQYDIEGGGGVAQYTGDCTTSPSICYLTLTTTPSQPITLTVGQKANISAHITGLQPCNVDPFIWGFDNTWNSITNVPPEGQVFHFTSHANATWWAGDFGSNYKCDSTTSNTGSEDYGPFEITAVRVGSSTARFDVITTPSSELPANAQYSGNYQKCAQAIIPIVVTDAITAQCLNVKTYNQSWVQLNPTQLTTIRAGNRIRFAVLGSASSGTFDKARFTINGTLRPEVTQKKPGTEEFYDEYLIPAGTTTFTISAQVHHIETNQWY